MGKAQRSKGLLGEREIRHLFEGAGFHVRGLSGQGDKLVFCASGVVLHVEAKRQETLRMMEWARQAAAEAPASAVPLVVYRQSREQWRADLTLADFLSLLRRLP